MGRVEFSEENKIATTNYDYPRLKLKSGERARIMAGLEAPVMEYVHTLRAPVVEHGRPVLIPVERRGVTTQEYKMNFISRPLCLGDASTLAAKGSDPKNCPICKLAVEHPDMAKAPDARYAMHVIRYRTKGQSFDIQTPFSVELLVWSFTPKVFNKIADIKKEFESLQKHDLTLGPCTNENFQQFDISVGAKAEFAQSQDRIDTVKTTFRENQIPDLSIACGSKKERQWIEDDINKIQAAWAEINGAPASSTSLDEDLNSLVSGASAQTDWLADSPASSESVPNEDDPFAGLKAQAPEESAATADDDDTEVGSFEDLLKDL